MYVNDVETHRRFYPVVVLNIQVELNLFLFLDFLQTSRNTGTLNLWTCVMGPKYLESFRLVKFLI